MKKTIYIVFVILIITLVGCETTKPDPIVDNVVVTPNTANVARGQSRQFTATVNGTNSPSQGVTWSITGGGTGTSISTSGFLSVSASEPANTIKIRATSNYDNTKYGTATVNVTGALVASVVVSPTNVNVAVGNTQQFTASVSGTGNPSQSVTWRVENQNSSSTSINSSGRLTVASNETANTLIVTATSTIDSNKMGTATVTVSTVGGTWNVNDVADWTDAVAGIRNGGNYKIHTINVNADIATPQNSGSLFGSATNIQVTLGGTGSLTPAANGALIAVGTGHTIILRNITLYGRAANSDAVVNIGQGGVFRMESGTIRDNSSPNGGSGIRVLGGSFVMSGGTITSNTATASANGAGVEVASGTFTMSGNATISSNYSNNYAGGVSILTSGSFTMEGGTISVNSALEGGGVGIFYGGTFTMNGGTIDNNTARSSTANGGGGVLVRSMNNQLSHFTMNGGTISNNSSAGVGGGVSVYAVRSGFYTSGTYRTTFTMNNGQILNNSASGNGGGVHLHAPEGSSYIVFRSQFTMNGGSILNCTSNGLGGGVTEGANSTFTKTSGTISGNTAVDRGNTAYRATGTLWRNANASPTQNTGDYGFWLND